MKDIFCAKCATITEHTGSVDQNGEILFVCTDCQHFVKFPQVSSKEELDGLIIKHEEINKPLAESRKAAAEQGAILAELLG